MTLNWSTMLAAGQAPASVLNAVAAPADARQLTLAADNAVIPVTYGRDRIGGKVLNVLDFNGALYIQVLWGMALDAIESVTLNDELPYGGAEHYLGDQVTVDGGMWGAFYARGITYTDTLHGYAYTVFQVDPTSISGSISATAVVRGRRVYDQRKDSTNGGSGSHRAGTPSTWEWSENPALCLQDFLRSTDYGAGAAVDYTSFALAATWNDTELTTGEPHRVLGLTLIDSEPVPSVREALRTYAGLFLARRGATWYAVQDKAATAAATYSHSAGTIAAWSDLEKMDLGNSPTVMEIIYTDASQIPWRDRTASVQLAGVDTGAVPYRLSTVRLPGIQRYSQAEREAAERLNKLQNDLTFSLTVFDQGVAHESGDVVNVTLPIGLTAKPMRVTEVSHAGPGLWELALVEYDPAAYSSTVNAAPTYPDTGLASPSAPPAVTGIVATEEIYQGANGLWFSRAKIDITAPEYIWLASYQVEIWDGTTLVHSGSTSETTYHSPPLNDGPTYSCRVRIASLSGAVAAWEGDSFACTGKLAAPSDVASITGFEIGGDIYLAWTPAVDVDIWRYELRYSATGGSWDTAALLDRVDALRYISKGVLSAGDWKVWVKALDSVGNYSANAASVTLNVTVDPDALQTEFRFVSPTLTNMLAYQLERGGATYYVTDPNAAGDKFGAAFTSNLGTYANALATYHTSATSTWQSEEHDFGVDLSGDWNVDAVLSALSGSYTVTLQLKPDGGAYSDHTTFPVKTAARYMKVKIEALTTATLLVDGGSVRGYCSAKTRKENGVKACSNTGTNTVSLVGKFFSYKTIIATPVGTSSPCYAVVNAITLSTAGANSFDLYLFNNSGTRISGDVAWKFEGV